MNVMPFAVRDVEAARLCGISRATFRRLHSAGVTPPAVKCGRRTLWRTADLEAWVNSGFREWGRR